MISDRSFFSAGKLMLLAAFYVVLPIVQAVFSAVVWGAFLYFVGLPALRDYFIPLLRSFLH